MDFPKIARIVCAHLVSPHLLPPEWEVDDVVSDVVLDLLEKYNQGKFTTEGEAFIIAGNRLKNLFRRWNTRPAIVSLDALQEAGWDTQSTPDWEDEWEDSIEVRKPTTKVSAVVKIFPWDIELVQSACGVSLKLLRKFGYKDEGDENFVSYPLSSRFVAGLIKGLVLCGTSQTTAVKVVNVALRSITEGCELTDTDRQVLYDFRRRAGEGIEWTWEPGGARLRTTLPNNRVVDVFVERS